MITIEQTAEDLFDKIRNRFPNVSMGDEQQDPTQDPKTARFWNFNFVHEGQNYGNITISLLDNSLKIFFDKDIDTILDREQKNIWFDWIKSMRKFAMSHVYIKKFDVRDIAKSGLNLNDLKFISKSSDTVTKNEVQTKEVNESKLYGTKRSSYQKLENVRIIARHSKPIVDETVPGVRSRNIESFYIENAQGERFKLPEGTTINGARAYARHVKNGGQLNDDFGRHINKMIREMNSLRMFVRNTRGRTFEDIETKMMVETAIDHYGKIHADLLLIRSQRGYDQYKELWQPEVLDEDDIDIPSLRERFVKKIFDDRIDDALPIVYRAYSQKRNRSLEEFESWANDILAEREINPIDKQNKKDIENHEDIEEDGIQVKSPFANSMMSKSRDMDGNIIDDDNDNSSLGSLLQQNGFEFKFQDGVYYFDSKQEISRAKDIIAYTAIHNKTKIEYPKMGVYDYGYGNYGSTTFDRELPGGKGVMENKNRIRERNDNIGDDSRLNAMKFLAGLKASGEGGDAPVQPEKTPAGINPAAWTDPQKAQFTKVTGQGIDKFPSTNTVNASPTTPAATSTPAQASTPAATTTATGSGPSWGWEEQEDIISGRASAAQLNQRRQAAGLPQVTAPAPTAAEYNKFLKDIPQGRGPLNLDVELPTERLASIASGARAPGRSEPKPDAARTALAWQQQYGGQYQGPLQSVDQDIFRDISGVELPRGWNYNKDWLEKQANATRPLSGLFPLTPDQARAALAWQQQNPNFKDRDRTRRRSKIDDFFLKETNTQTIQKSLDKFKKHLGKF